MGTERKQWCGAMHSECMRELYVRIAGHQVQTKTNTDCQGITQVILYPLNIGVGRVLAYGVGYC